MPTGTGGIVINGSGPGFQFFNMKDGSGWVMWLNLLGHRDKPIIRTDTQTNHAVLSGKYFGWVVL